MKGGTRTAQDAALEIFRAHYSWYQSLEELKSFSSIRLHPTFEKYCVALYTAAKSSAFSA